MRHDLAVLGRQCCGGIVGAALVKVGGSKADAEGFDQLFHLLETFRRCGEGLIAFALCWRDLLCLQRAFEQRVDLFLVGGLPAVLDLRGQSGDLIECLLMHGGIDAAFQVGDRRKAGSLGGVFIEAKGGGECFEHGRFRLSCCREGCRRDGRH